MPVPNRYSISVNKSRVLNTGPIRVDVCTALLSYPTFKTRSKNGDSYQVMTQAIRQEPLLTTLHLLPAGSRIMGGQEKSQRYLGWGNPGQPLRWDCFRSMTAVSNAQPYPEEHTTTINKHLEYL
jgi:hypothetical protein